MSEQDSAFYASFKGGMDKLGLPCPETLFGSFTTAIATVGAMANTVKTFGPKVVVSDFHKLFPALSGGASIVGVAGATAEITTALGGCAASFYLGAVVGCLIGAAIDVYGVPGLVRLGSALGGLSPKLGPIDRLIEGAARNWPGFALLDTSVHVVRSLGIGSTDRGQTVR